MQLRGSLGKKLVLGLVFVCLIATVAVTITMFQKARSELRQLATPEGQAERARLEATETHQALQKVAVVPDEQPLVATILDGEKLRAQSPLSAEAETGDKIVIYPTAQKMFVFRITTNKVVSMGPLSLEAPTESPQ